MTSPVIEVTNVIFPNGYVWVSCEYIYENPTTGKSMTLLLLHTLRQRLGLNCTATWRSWAGLSSDVTLTVICINEEGEKRKVETG